MNSSIERKHYSLVIVFSIFIVAMASLVFTALFYDRNDNNKVLRYDFSVIENINPLLLEESDRVVDKTNANILLAEEIKRVYDIDVTYGEGTEYLSKSVEATPIYDESDINEILLQLIDCLEKYPNNIFKEIQIKGYDLEICIVNYFNNDNVALATRDSNNNFKIFLSNVKKDDKVVKSVHHEMYHILEYYIKLEFNLNDLYKDWNSYNPSGFSYENNISLLDNKYVYGMDSDTNAYFVSIYSKCSDKEDRAEVFADTMAANDKPNYYIINNDAIKNKMKLISYVINECFYSVNYGISIYWTRYL